VPRTIFAVNAAASRSPASVAIVPVADHVSERLASQINSPDDSASV